MSIEVTKDIADTKSTERDTSPPTKYFTVTEVVTDSTIQAILKQENSNLKQQNMLLLNQIHKLTVSNKKYRDLYNKQKLELMKLKEEGKVHKARADEMKGIIMNKLMALQGKMMATTKEAVS